MQKYFRESSLVVCGHVDHGKSTLIGRLLVDTRSLSKDKLKDFKNLSRVFGEEVSLAHLSDQLKEERKENMTIETTQIFIHTKKYHYRLIDIPGHLGFIKNSLTGASQADAALLVVDIQDGIQVQTHRHMHLLSFLGIKKAIVLINKMDLKDYSQECFTRFAADLQSFLIALDLEPVSIIPISAKLGENVCRESRRMPWYQGPFLSEAIHELCCEKTTRGREQEDLLRFPVQDIYQLEGARVIVGRIATGTMVVGQPVVLLPQRANAKLRSILSFPVNKRSAGPGENLGVIIDRDVEVQRGNMISTKAASLKRISFFIGNILWLDTNPLFVQKDIRVQCSTQVFTCRVMRILKRVNPADSLAVEQGAHSVEQNQAAIIEFEVLGTAFLEIFEEVPEFGRFTMEDERGLLGVGTVLQLRG